MCERDPVQASAGVSDAKITLISYREGDNECALSWLSYIWRRVCFLKACLCDDRMNAQKRQGSCRFSLPLWEKDILRSSEIFALYIICMCVYFHFHMRRAFRCPDGGGHSVHGLLLPRVYLRQ